MGGEQAANVLLQVKMDQLKAQSKTMSGAEQQEFLRPILEKYNHEGNAYYSTARLWDDGIIDPADTRMVLALGISAAMNAPPEETRFGVFRM
jgi:acetyl-CoA carboxylase carboxyltransferase component